MKACLAIDPSAAFPDSTHMPGDPELAATLGPAWPPVGDVLARLHAAHPKATGTWQFSRQVGWYRIQFLKKRRLLYLMPRRGDFRLMMILGGKALTRLQAGPFASRVTRLFKTAKRYPEGTMFDFERASLAPDLLTAFLEAKISPEPRGTGLPSHFPTESHRARKHRTHRP